MSKQLKNVALGLALLSSLAACTGGKKQTGMSSSSTKYKYETVANDPLGVKMYTLSNGMRVYMSVNKDAPRIQTFIATRAGSKNDPADATGLAHYLEHMLFKGTQNIGALNWDKEKPMLDEIARLYEAHRQAKPEDRAAIYKQIDSISFEAAKLVSANEYDRMISSLGAKGTNAYTSLDQTVYVNDIPSNELEKWLIVESERFKQLVLRLFHTELEAVYEEFNISQGRDSRKVFSAFMSALLPNHPYGTQTTIGTSEHLKTPSMYKIQQYFEKYYVPNNMAIVLAGDFDPDQALTWIEKYFGGYAKKAEPTWEVKPQAELTQPVVKEVLGREKAIVDIVWRTEGTGSREAMLARLASQLLSNGQAGLIDLNLVQAQKTGPQTYGFGWAANDFGFFGLYGEPRQGQSLEELRDLLFGELNKLRKGEFEDWMLEAIVNNLEYQSIKNMENNYGRADAMLSAFIANQDWKEQVAYFETLRKFTKKDIVDFLNTRIKDNNYVIVYKREGEDPNIAKVEKPAITPVTLNRDVSSKFKGEFDKLPTPRQKPEFLDFKTRIQNQNLASGVRLDYIHNPHNQTFDLNYILEMGDLHDKTLGIAIRLLPFLGTDKYSAVDLQKEFFKLGLSFDVSAGSDVTYVSLSGLDRSFEKGVELFEHILANVKPDDKALEDLVNTILKERSNAKKNKDAILRSAMVSYARYGQNSPFLDRLTEAELKALKASDLVAKIKTISQFEHHVFYYGSLSKAEVAKHLDKHHKVPAKRQALPAKREYKELDTDKDRVVFVDFAGGTAQAEILMVSKATQGFNLQEDILSRLYGDYFGAGLSSIVFQEIREARALAYSASAFYSSPSLKEDAHYLRAYVGTQPDKMKDAITAMRGIVDTMPIVEEQLLNAISAAAKRIESERITRSGVYWNYRNNLRRGFDRDIRKDAYDFFNQADPKKVIEALKKFQLEKVRGRKYTILILGDKSALDMEYVKRLGELKELSLQEVFGY